MSKFKVKGALRETAEDVEVIVEASSYKEAVRAANKMGILVSDVLAIEETVQKRHEPSVALTAPPDSKKKSKVKTIVIISIAAILLFSCMLSTLIPAIGRVTSDSKDSKRNTTTSSSSKELTRDEKIKKLFHWYDASHTNSINIIKKSLHNPDSFELVDTVFWDMQNHLIVKTTYRAENGFGATRTNWVKTKIDMDGDVLQVIEQSE